MFSGSTRPRSIASQLVLLFTLAATVLLCCGFGLLYFIFIRHAAEEDNEALRDKAAALSANLASAGHAEVLRDEINTSARDERVNYLVRVRGPAGAIEAETAGMADILPQDVFAGATQSRPIESRAQGRTFALLSKEVALGNGSYILQVAQDRSADERFQRTLGWLLAGLLGAGTVASALIAIQVTRRGLRPLAQMTQALERIGPTRLQERVPPEGWPRELQPLASAFAEMLDRLEVSFTRLSQFSADLAHELRTPIANLRGESEVALTRPRTPEEYREVIESSVAECERLSGIIDNLLFLARAEGSDRSLERKHFPGVTALQKIAEYYETVAEERKVEVLFEGSGDIYADPVLFNRAITNLLDNALRHTPDDAPIYVKLRVSEGTAEVSVTDSGSGIAAEHLPRVFDRFYQVDPSRSSAGSGLGLALVKSIMEMHGGEARVASEPGRGTTVTLTFPGEAKRDSAAEAAR